jgi:hypothetical protein
VTGDRDRPGLLHSTPLCPRVTLTDWEYLGLPAYLNRSNRRMRTRMSGGVGGGVAGISPVTPYPDYSGTGPRETTGLTPFPAGTWVPGVAAKSKSLTVNSE